MPAADLSELVCFLYLTFLLGFSAYTDWRDNIIPTELILFSGYPLIMLHAILFLDMNTLLLRAAAAGCIFLIFYLNARFLNGGGGDAILFPLLPLFLGITSYIIIAGGCILNIPIHFVRKLANRGLNVHEIPVAPGVFIMYLLVCFFLWRFFV